MSALELDAREGILDESGRQTGRQGLRRVLRRFSRATDPRNPKKARKDPLRVLNIILGKKK
jgi:hypothetical protein